MVILVININGFYVVKSGDKYKVSSCGYIGDKNEGSLCRYTGDKCKGSLCG